MQNIANKEQGGGSVHSPPPHTHSRRGQVGLLEDRYLQERELGSHGTLSQHFPEGV